MYTVLYLDKADAEFLYDSNWRGVINLDARAARAFSMDDILDINGSITAGPLDAVLRYDANFDLYSLTFSGYLHQIPAVIKKNEITPCWSQLKRVNSAVTRAKAGTYDYPGTGCTASVEKTLVKGPNGSSHWVHNIEVNGFSLRLVQAFNSMLSAGEAESHLVHSFS